MGLGFGSGGCGMGSLLAVAAARAAFVAASASTSANSSMALSSGRAEATTQPWEVDRSMRGMAAWSSGGVAIQEAVAGVVAAEVEEDGVVGECVMVVEEDELEAIVVDEVIRFAVGFGFREDDGS